MFKGADNISRYISQLGRAIRQAASKRANQVSACAIQSSNQAICVYYALRSRYSGQP